MLDAMENVGGHNSGHKTNMPELPLRKEPTEVTESEGEYWRALEDDFRTLSLAPVTKLLSSRAGSVPLKISS